jgi:Flp pilus assembly protein TadD
MRKIIILTTISLYALYISCNTCAVTFAQSQNTHYPLLLTTLSLPQTAEELRKQGDEAFNNKRWTEAIAAYEKAKPAFTKDMIFLNGFGIAYYRLAKEQDQAKQPNNAAINFSKAISLFTEAITLEPKNNTLWDNQGNAYEGLALVEPKESLQETWYTIALKDYNKSLELGNDTAHIHGSKAGTLSNLKRFPEAEKSYRDALRIEPTNAKWHNYLAQTCAKQEKWLEAEMAYREAFKLESTSGIYANQIAYYLLKQGKRDEAKTFVEKAQSLGYVNEKLIAELGVTKAPTKSKPADLISKSTESPEELRKQGDEAARNKRWEEAIAAYEKARPKFQKDAQFFNLLAGYYRYLGKEQADAKNKDIAKINFGKSVKFYEEAISLLPKNHILLANIGRVWIDLGLSELDSKENRNIYFTNALNAYDKSLAIDSKNVNVINNRGSVLFELQRFSEAEQSFREVLRIDPNNANTSYNLGAICAKQEKWPEAEAAYREAFRLESTKGVLAYQIAFTLSKQGKRDEAKVYADKAQVLGFKDEKLIAELNTTSPSATSPSATPHNVPSKPNALKKTFKNGEHCYNLLNLLVKEMDDPDFKKQAESNLKIMVNTLITLEDPKRKPKDIKEIQANKEFADSTARAILITCLTKQGFAFTKLVDSGDLRSPKVASRPAPKIEALIEKIRANRKVFKFNQDADSVDDALQDITESMKTMPDKQREQAEASLSALAKALDDATVVYEMTKELTARLAKK